MDIWEWTYEATRELHRRDERRLASIMRELPSAVCDGEHDQAEAMTPEGVELARRLDMPWIEVFLRHWLAQSRILHRRDVTRGMDEVIRLLDFAHGERTAKCPQSVCVTQDVCSAYEVLDGPGYSDERLAVSAETLARIDVTWPCFECISGEYASALFDAERYADCEKFAREQMEKIRLGAPHTQPQIIASLADALSRQGRHQEALQALDGMRVARMGKAEKRRYQLHRARELAIAGRVDEALAEHLGVDDIDPSEFTLWTRTEVALIAARPQRNDARLGRTLRGFIGTLRANGALFDQARLAVVAGRLALQRGKPALTRLHLEEIDALLPKLRRPELLRDLPRLRADTPPLVATAGSADAALATLGADAEANLEILASACATHADHEALALARCRAWQEVGFHERARTALEEFVRDRPDSAAALDALLTVLVASRDEAALRALAASVAPKQRAGVQRHLGRFLLDRQRWAEAAVALEAALALEPDSRVAMSCLALALRHLDRHEESLALLDRVVADPAFRADHWQRMVVAGLSGRDDLLRASAAALDHPPLGPCTIRVADERGRDIDFPAERVNPVVARITSLQGPHEPSRFGDEVLFEPQSLNGGRLPAFRALKVLRPGGYRSYDLTGATPEPAAFAALEQALAAVGVAFSLLDHEFEIRVTDDADPVPAFYALLAVPPALSTEALYEHLKSALASWTVPLIYMRLLEELGLDAEHAAQEQIAGRLVY